MVSSETTSRPIFVSYTVPCSTTLFSDCLLKEAIVAHFNISKHRLHICYQVERADGTVVDKTVIEVLLRAAKNWAFL